MLISTRGDGWFDGALFENILRKSFKIHIKEVGLILTLFYEDEAIPPILWGGKNLSYTLETLNY